MIIEILIIGSLITTYLFAMSRVRPQETMGRLEYFLCGLLVTPFYYLAMWLADSFNLYRWGTGLYVAGLVFAYILMVGILWFQGQWNVKRLNDLRWSTWLAFLLPIPIIGTLFLLLLCLMPGKNQPSSRPGTGPRQYQQ